MREQLEQFLEQHGASKGDTETLIAHFLNTPFTARKVLFNIMRAHPEFLTAFLSIIRKKREFAGNPSKVLAGEIVAEEKNLLAGHIATL